MGIGISCHVDRQKGNPPTVRQVWHSTCILNEVNRTLYDVKVRDRRNQSMRLVGVAPQRLTFFTARARSTTGGYNFSLLPGQNRCATPSSPFPLSPPPPPHSHIGQGCARTVVWRGRYASCVNAGGLSCFAKCLKEQNSYCWITD